LLLRELRTSLFDQGRAMLAVSGILERRQCPGDIAAGGRTVCFVQHGALALRTDLCSEESDARVVGSDGTRLLGELLRGIEMLSLQLGFCGREQLVDHLLESVDGARIAAIALERLTIKLRGVLGRRRDQRTGGERLIGARQQALERGVIAGDAGTRRGRRVW